MALIRDSMRAFVANLEFKIMITKELDDLIKLLVSVRPCILNAGNIEYFDERLGYEFGISLGQQVGEESSLCPFCLVLCQTRFDAYWNEGESSLILGRIAKTLVKPWF